jgi:hypothetical protein
LTYSLALITLKTTKLKQQTYNWDDFSRLFNERLTLNVSLKTKDLEAAVKFINDTIQ